ncbi:hypothetical protein [Vreelandella aquamarina]|uniref:hypothetical protein n=1 Tax=Vreelandella aquamarina TaxID=77097 RepID=UPI001D17619F|nr:hypothetical protein [Halomonas axialensis]MCC4290641.1 hypothetical protein [Halomonas axialensis]
MNARSRKTTVKAAAESMRDATADKPLAGESAADDTLDTATPNNESVIAEEDRIRILKKATCPKLSSRASGTLSYEIGIDANATGEESSLSDHTWLRITANQSSGYFSQEWIQLTAILALIDQQTVPFKAILFKPLYERKGANNHGFLGAALKAEGLVIADEQQPLVLHPADKRDAFWDQIKTAIEEGIDLTDEVAQENARKEARKQARLAEQQRRRDANAQKITASSSTPSDSDTAKTTPDCSKNPSLSADGG